MNRLARLTSPLILLLAGGASAATLTQNFDAVAPVPSQASGPGSACPQDAGFIASGWRVVNASDTAGSPDSGGTRCVTQGYPDSMFFPPADAFTAQAGAANAYAGFPFSAGFVSPSLWMITPRVRFGEGATLEFWTRRTTVSNRIDRLQVRVMFGDGPPVAGTSSHDVGAFTTMVLEINPSGAQGSVDCPVNGHTDPAGGQIAFYPHAWCRVRLTAAGGLPQAGSGYIALRYDSPFGHVANGYVVGVDSFAYDEGLIAAPALSYGQSPGSTVNGVGGLAVGSSAAFAIPVTVGTAGGGSGAEATTLLQCTSPGAPFAGFDTPISVVGAQPLGHTALSGTCIRSSADVTRILSCTEKRGLAAPIPISFALHCPAAITDATLYRLSREVQADDPLAYWRLGEAGEAIFRNSASGPSSVGALADSLTSNALTRDVAAVPPTGVRADGALQFCKDCAAFMASNAFDLQPAGASGYTIETWLQFEDAPTGYTSLVSDRTGDVLQSFAFLYLKPDRRLRMHVVTWTGPGDFDFVLNSVDSDLQLDMGRPHHVVATWNAADGQIRLHVNGEIVATQVVTGSNPTLGVSNLLSDHVVYLGHDFFETVRTTLRLDETAIYARALPLARIRRHHEAGSLINDSFED